MTPSERNALRRQVDQLAAERVALFALVQQESPRATDARSRLKSVERQIDECFAALRRLQATRDADRFARHLHGRRPVRPPSGE